MKTLAGILGLCCFLVVGCSRHVVAERSAGRADPKRSVAMYGDSEWKVVREPIEAPLDGDGMQEQQEAP